MKTIRLFGIQVNFFSTDILCLLFCFWTLFSNLTFAQIGSGPMFEDVFRIAVEDDGNLLVTDIGLDAVLRVDAVTGDRTILSDASTGSGPTFMRPYDLAVEADGNLLVTDNGLDAVLRVDPVTGDRTILSDTSTGTGPVITNPAGISTEADGNVILIDRGVFAIVRVDPVTGDRTVLSDESIGSGPTPSFSSTLDIAVETDGSIVVLDALLDAILRIDPISGDRTIVSNPSIGSGPVFEGPIGLAIEADGNLVATDRDGVFRIDPVTGDRVIITDANIGSGTVLIASEGIEVEEDGSIVVTDYLLKAIVRINPFTGDRSIVSGGMMTSLNESHDMSMNNITKVFPNPFNEFLAINFEVSTSGQVYISIYDVMGQSIRNLKGEWISEGNHSIVWDGKNDAGQISSPGIYFIHLKTEGFVSQQSVMLNK